MIRFLQQMKLRSVQANIKTTKRAVELLAPQAALLILAHEKGPRKSSKGGETDIDIIIATGGKPPMGNQPIAGLLDACCWRSYTFLQSQWVLQSLLRCQLLAPPPAWDCRWGVRLADVSVRLLRPIRIWKLDSDQEKVVCKKRISPRDILMHLLGNLEARLSKVAKS